MRPLSALTSLLALCPLASSQTVYLSEDFNSGVVPPTNWSEINNGVSLGWETNVNGDGAWHDDYLLFNDNHLLSPQMNLTGAGSVYLHFEQEVVFALWRDHHYVDVSLDNGVTFTNLLDSLAGDGASTETVDLSSYAGVNGVNVSFHYTGDFASEWTIDDMVVNDSALPPPPAIEHTAINPANGRTYHLLEAAAWDVSDAAALNLGGTLVVLEDQAENDWVYQTFATWNGHLGRDLWIGLNDELVEGSYVWSNGTPLGAYSNWAPGEPNNSASGGVNGEDYVHLYGNSGMWNDNSVDGSPWNTAAQGVVEVGGGVSLSVTNLVAGQTANFTIGGATANGIVGLGYSLAGPGPATANAGPCGPITVEMSQPITVLPLFSANANGVATAQANVPAGTTGISVWLQGMDVATCTLTNSVAAVIG